MNQDEKRVRYDAVAQEIAAVVGPTRNPTSRMATVCCLLSEAFPYYFWTGFYLVDPDNPHQLVIGPYQGSLGCLVIPFGKGVCGTAAETAETQIVADVHTFPGHIACDVRSNSEIVVPVRDAKGRLIAVLDVDSKEHDSFDEVDQKHLEMIMENVFAGGE